MIRGFNFFLQNCEIGNFLTLYGQSASGILVPASLDLSLVVPSGAEATDYLSPSSSVLCCCLHLPPAVPDGLLCPFLSPNLFSTCSLVALYFCGPAVSTVMFVWQCYYHSFSLCPSQFHLLLLSCISTGSWSVCLNNSLLAILSGQCITIRRKHLLTKLAACISSDA